MNQLNCIKANESKVQSTKSLITDLNSKSEHYLCLFISDFNRYSMKIRFPGSKEITLEEKGCRHTFPP